MQIDINKKVEKYIKDINLHLEKNLENNDDKLFESMRYTLMAPCKRIRPLIMLGFYELCGGKNEEIYKFTSAIEMIHTYSLIHDDLPCMDDDKIRRGKECNHIKFGEDTALLAGDALLTKAFEVASSGEFCNIENTLKCINILAGCAGSNGMILGQSLDLNTLKSECKNELLLKIHELKTANLFIASAKIGTTLANGTQKQIELAEQWGKNIGIAFQIMDDISDKDILPNETINEVQALDLASQLISSSKDILKNNFNGDSSLLDYLVNLIK